MLAPASVASTSRRLIRSRWLAMSSGPDGKRGLLAVARQLELRQVMVRMTGRHHGVVRDESGERVEQAVVEDDPELCRPSAGEAYSSGLVQPVGESPRRRGRCHRDDLAHVGAVEWDRIADRGLVWAALTEPVGEAVPVAGIEQFGQGVSDDHRRHGGVRRQRGGQCLPRRRGDDRLRLRGRKRLRDAAHQRSDTGAAARIGVVFPQRRMLVTAEPQQLGKGHHRVDLGGDQIPERREPIGGRSQ